MDISETEQLVKQALAGGDLQAAFVSLNDKCQELKASVDGGPVKKVSPDLYKAADKLKLLAHQLALYLGEQDNPLEEPALQLRASPILTMYGHHRHKVGPAMIDWAECNRRLGNLEKADMLYQAVINDFIMLLEPEPSAHTEWFTALESLKKALEGHSGDHSADVVRVKKRLNQWQELVSKG